MRKFVMGALALALSGLCAGPAPANIGSPVATGQVRPWATIGSSTSVTLEKAVTHAKRFSVITAFAETYRNYVQQMKAANPKLRLFVYMNSAFTWEKGLPESYYAHDAYGRRIYARSWPSTFMLEPSSSGANVYQQKRAASLLSKSGYDGVYADVLGLVSLEPSYVSSLPINPATKKRYTPNQWLQQMTKVARMIRSYTGRPVLGNGLMSGTRYFDTAAPTEQLLDSGMHGGVPEAFLRPPEAAASAYPTETKWKQNVNMLIDAGARGVSVFTVTKVWSSATLAQKDAWLKYSLASFLLGQNGNHWFHFSYGPNDFADVKKWTSLSLGSASGGYAKKSGVYQRDFTKGKVLVNPTTSTAIVSLGRVYYTLSGKAVTSVTLPPNTAEILTL